VGPETPIAHGTAKGYRRGCRCAPCRAARARDAASRRQSGPERLVSTAAARRHLQRFRHVGYRRLAALARLSATLLLRIRRGRLLSIRASTAAKILSITRSAADGALVSTWRTRKLLDALAGEGWARTDVEGMLGLPPRALRCRSRRVRVKTARLVEALYQRLMQDALADDDPRAQDPVKRRATG